jgi:anti-sigma factor RsiW
MNEIEFIKKLDAASGPPPEIDVADRVMRQIRLTHIRAVESSPMWIGALLSAVAAAAVLLLALQAFSGLQDPFGDLLTPLLTAFQ